MEYAKEVQASLDEERRISSVLRAESAQVRFDHLVAHRDVRSIYGRWSALITCRPFRLGAGQASTQLDRLTAGGYPMEIRCWAA
jgi:hypothetical protein